MSDDMNEVLKSMLDDTRQRLLDNANNVVDDFARDVEYNFARRMKEAEETAAAMTRQVELLKAQYGEQSDNFGWQHAVDYLKAVFDAAERRQYEENKDDVDAVRFVQANVVAWWEIKDQYAHEGVRKADAAEIRELMISQGYSIDALHIPNVTYVIPNSRNDADLRNWTISDESNAYIYKGKCEMVGVNSVAITDCGFVIYIDEYIHASGRVYLRTHVVDPERGVGGVEFPEPPREIRF